MTLKKLTLEALREQFGPNSQDLVGELRKQQPTATHLVLFQNTDFSSREFGAQSIVAVGPKLTYKSPQVCEGKHLNDLPSQRQYPVAYTDLSEAE